MGVYQTSKNVNIQDQTTPPFQYYLMREDKTDITLTGIVLPNDVIIHVNAGHGFTAGGEYICIFDNNRFLQTKVLAVNINAITVQNASAYNFSLNAKVIRGSIELNVDASSTPQEFIFNFRNATIPIDITHSGISMIHSAEGDLSKFGGIPALTTGIIFRKQNNNIQNLGLYLDNSDFIDYGANLEFTSKVDGGVYGTKINFAIRDTYGVVIRINPRECDIFKAIIHDKLDTLLKFRINIIGHYTEGE